MELTNVPVFGKIRQKMGWLNQRQKVLAQNIANADTPEYRARDLKALKLDGKIREPATFRISVSTTNPMHIGIPRRGTGNFKEADVRRPLETAPNGNSVVLEEQMVKMNQTVIDHGLVTELYKKHMNMIRTAVRSGGAT